MTLIVETIQWRNDTAARWASMNPVLLAGGCSYTLVVFILAPGFAMQIVRQLGAAIMPTRFAI